MSTSHVVSMDRHDIYRRAIALLGKQARPRTTRALTPNIGILAGQSLLAYQYSAPGSEQQDWHLKCLCDAARQIQATIHIHKTGPVQDGQKLNRP